MQFKLYKSVSLPIGDAENSGLIQWIKIGKNRHSGLSRRLLKREWSTNSRLKAAGMSCTLTLLFTTNCFCRKFVEVSPPLTQLVSASVFSSNATASAAQTAIYTSMASGYGFDIELYSGWSSDELAEYAGSGSFQQDLFFNELTAANDGNSLSGIWSNPYNYIYQANAMLAGLEGSNGVDMSVKQQLMGEAYFVRALCYFYLTNFYGSVPLITTTSYQASSVATRTAQAQVYEQIIQDLKTAEGLLNNNFVDATDTTVTTERVRPTKSAALALLARVYLYTTNYTDAAAAATSVINNPLFSLPTNLNQIFLITSPEAIWQLEIPPTQYYTTDGSFFILTSSPNNTPTGCGLNSFLLNAFEPGDLRRQNWVDSIIIAGTTFYFPYKYKSGSTSTTLTEYNMVLRLAEQYLIRAEAEAELKATSSAIADVNVIRKRAGLPLLPSTLTQSQILKAIAHERQVELFTEWGDRWLNLKRTGTVDSVMNTVTPLKGGITWQSYQQLYPIPQTDITNDQNLQQTSGY